MMLVAAITTVALASVSCGGDKTAEFDLITEGTLTICADIPYPPFEYEDNGEIVGFDVEIMDAIADDLGLQTVWLGADFGMITAGTAMAAGTCDMAASAITITQEREDGGIDFGDPYFTADQSLLVKKDSGIQTLTDLDGKVLAVQSDTTGEIYANEHNPGAVIVSYDNPATMFLALEAGDVDGVLQDIGPNADQAKADETVEITEIFTTSEQYGFAFQAGDDDLRIAVNDALAKIRENGTYQTIYDKYFTAG